MIKVKGIASYPRLNEPDTKFDAAGNYNTKLILTPETAEPLIARFDQMRAAKAAEVEEKENGKAPELNDHPLQPEFDDDGNETGNYVLSTKMKASGTSKKTGKAWSRKLPLFDSLGNETNTRVGGGSEIICAIDPITYAMSDTVIETGEDGKKRKRKVTTVGVSLRLEAVQIIKAGGFAKDASGFGFGKHEGGFVASEDDEPVAPSAAADEGEEDGKYEF